MWASADPLAAAAAAAANGGFTYTHTHTHTHTRTPFKYPLGVLYNTNGCTQEDPQSRDRITARTSLHAIIL
jgi:hypothetical protein